MPWRKRAWLARPGLDEPGVATEDGIVLYSYLVGDNGREVQTLMSVEEAEAYELVVQRLVLEAKRLRRVKNQSTL